MEKEGELKSYSYFINLGLNMHEVGKIKTVDESLPLSWKRNMAEEQNVKETDFDFEGRTIEIRYINSKQIYLQFLKSKGDISAIFYKFNF